MSKRIKLKCDITLEIARKDVNRVIDHARKVCEENPCFEYSDDDKGEPIPPKVRVVDLQDAIEELIYYAVGSMAQGLCEVKEWGICRPEKCTPSKSLTRHRLVVDSVDHTSDPVRTKAHCACGEWTCDIPVPSHGDWQHELSKAYREQHHKKNLALKRVSIDAALAGLLDRVEAVNKNPDFYCYIGAVVLFGSCLTDKERPGDVDVAIRTIDRVPRDTPEGKALLKKVFARPHPRFGDMVTEIYWPETEVTRFVKGGKRMFSVIGFSELKSIKAPYSVLFGNRAEIVAELGYQPLPESR